MHATELENQSELTAYTDLAMQCGDIAKKELFLSCAVPHLRHQCPAEGESCIELVRRDGPAALWSQLEALVEESVDLSEKEGMWYEDLLPIFGHGQWENVSDSDESEVTDSDDTISIGESEPGPDEDFLTSVLPMAQAEEDPQQARRVIFQGRPVEYQYILIGSGPTVK